MSKFQVFLDEQPAVEAMEVEVEKKPERKVLSCLSNVLPNNEQVLQANTHFPQKKHKNKHKKVSVSQSKSHASQSKDTAASDSTENTYIKDILGNMKFLESQQQVRSNYMMKQKDLKPYMRSMLVEWLIEVANYFNPSPEVIFTTINYLDRFLSKMEVKKNRFQLLGITCLNTAWKFEDVNSRPNLNDLVYFTDNACTYQEVVTMEALLVETLDFHLNAATPYHFLSAFLAHSHLPNSVSLNSKNLLRNSLLEGTCSFKHRPSMLSASILFIAIANHGLHPWSDQLVQLTGYSMKSLEVCVKELVKISSKTSHHHHDEPLHEEKHEKH